MTKSILAAALLLGLSLGASSGFAADAPAYPGVAQLNLLDALACPPQSTVKPDAGKSCPSLLASLEARDLAAVVEARKDASDDERTLAIQDGAPPSLAQLLRPMWSDLVNPAAKSCALPAKAVDAADDKALAKLLPATAELWKNARKAQSDVVGKAKGAFSRWRPYAAFGHVPDAPKIEALVPTKDLGDSSSYPSGHTTFAFFSYVVLIQILPEDQDALFARAKQYAWHRVIVGAHFPTDIVAGEESGMLIGGTFLQDAGFRSSLEAARTELRHALCY
jgi:hypothetical protein